MKDGGKGEIILVVAVLAFLGVDLPSETIRQSSDGIISIELMNHIGGPDAASEQESFRLPMDAALDASGNLYVLDAGNGRIQVFSARGEFQRTIGRFGQGPGEFDGPESLDVAPDGRIYVFDGGRFRVHVLTSEGRALAWFPVKETSQSIRCIDDDTLVQGGLRIAIGGPLKLLQLRSPDGRGLGEFGDPRDYGDDSLNTFANWIDIAMGRDRTMAVSFRYQNRIEAYSAEGRLIWRTSLALPYSTGAAEKGHLKFGERSRSVQMPQMTQCSKGIAIDGDGRIWLASVKAPPAPEAGIAMTGSGRRETPDTGQGPREIDILAVLDPAGRLLTTVPIPHLANAIRCRGEELVIVDSVEACVWRYRIVQIPFEGLREVIEDPSGNIGATDYMAGRAFLFDASGSLKGELKGGETVDTKPFGIAWGGSGFILSAGSVLRFFDRDGEWRRDVKFEGTIKQVAPLLGGLRVVLQEFAGVAFSHRLVRLAADDGPAQTLLDLPSTIFYQPETSTAIYHSFAFGILIASLGSSEYVWGYSRDYELEIRDRTDVPRLRIRKAGAAPGFDARERRRLKGLLSQDHKAFFYRILTDDRNRIYVVTDDPRGSEGDLSCDIFGRDGTYLYRTAIPEGTRAIEAGRLLALARCSADDQPNRIVRFEIVNWDRIAVEGGAQR